MAAALKDHGIDDVILLERGVVGQAWLEYPAETHLLSETAVSHDDNMIAGISLASVFPNIPHPSHVLYQKYLAAIAEAKQLKIKERHKVRDIIFDPKRALFRVLTNHGELKCEFLVWAAGMYSTPSQDLEGQECYTHYAKIADFSKITDQAVTVIGSANGASGVVMELAKPGRRITLVSPHPYTIPQPIDCLWKENMVFVQDLEKQGLVEIVEDFRVGSVKKSAEGYQVTSTEGKTMTVPNKPIVCIGFKPNIGPIMELVDEVRVDHETKLAISPAHESLKRPKLFLAGCVGKLEADKGTIMFFRDFGIPIAKKIKSYLAHR